MTLTESAFGIERFVPHLYVVSGRSGELVKLPRLPEGRQRQCSQPPVAGPNPRFGRSLCSLGRPVVPGSGRDCCLPEPATLEDLAARRRDADRPTHVHVVGDFDQDPPGGLATAHRVAALLVDEDGTVRDDDFDEREDGDVAFVRIDEHADERSEREQVEVRRRSMREVSAWYLWSRVGCRASESATSDESTRTSCTPKGPESRRNPWGVGSAPGFG